MKNGNEEGPSQRLQARAGSGLLLSWWHWLRNILLKPTSTQCHVDVCPIPPCLSSRRVLFPSGYS